MFGRDSVVAHVLAFLWRRSQDPTMPAVKLLFVVLAVLASACGQSSGPEPLRFSVLPDWNKGQLRENAEVLADVLTGKLGRPVRYVPSDDYTACVQALSANVIDFVWLGGKTTVDALDAGRGRTQVLATRDIDLKFRSYFVGNAGAVAAGKIQAVDGLQRWRGATKELRFTFGSLNSTSGHLMPRWFLSEAGIDPEADFKLVAYQEVGSHAATLEAVASGAFDCGALNYAYYDRAPDATKAKAPILYTTPEYVDYAWVVHDRVGADLVEGIRAALLGLQRSNPREAQILDAWAAGAFVSADKEQWQPIRAVRDSLGTGFLGK